jgi:hypothetical protein
MAALIKAFDPVLGWMARRYQAAVAKELKNYGLRYEDLMDPAMDLVLACRHAYAVHPPPFPPHPRGLAPNPKMPPLPLHPPCGMFSQHLHCRT